MELHDDEFGFRKHLMGLDPRWDPAMADPPIDQSKAVWLGHNGDWDLWAVPEGTLVDGTVHYSLQAVSETDDCWELPCDVPATVAHWRRMLADNVWSAERVQAGIMLEAYERLCLVRSDIAQQVTLDQLVGVELADELRAHASEVRTILRTAPLN